MWNRNGNSRTRFRDIRPMFNEPHCRERRIVAVVLELIFSPSPPMEDDGMNEIYD